MKEQIKKSQKRYVKPLTKFDCLRMLTGQGYDTILIINQMIEVVSFIHWLTF